ncbi:MAG: hypothetical protein NVSMB46_00580 [Candidatus Saccharimonadales bacterium]
MKYILGVLGIVFVLIFAIVLLVRQPSTKSSSDNPPAQKLVLSKYANSGANVQLTISGRLVGEDKRRAVRISVNQNQRTVEILDGYGEVVERSEQFSNTQPAYDNFLHALDNAQFTRSRKIPRDDERGTCPLGNRYNYELQVGNDVKSNLWNTSCSSAEGTFIGNGPLIRELFRVQIPDYDTFTSNVSL